MVAEPELVNKPYRRSVGAKDVVVELFQCDRAIARGEKPCCQATQFGFLLDDRDLKPRLGQAKRGGKTECAAADDAGRLRAVEVLQKGPLRS